MLEIDGLETTKLLVAVRFTELRFNSCALPGAIVERDLNIKVRSNLEVGVDNTWNFKVDAPYWSRRKAAGGQEATE